ncbi:hypothetical protein [Clostridium sp. BL-8]|uniref:coiled-coil domain-containing protein n=1 Tax=Clostridium sp. BL-8 TaxID=349938 RepID=UPI00098CD46B|nr:hypothetical protein [Clostridium sp. BL-8]OOM79892.1 chromosome partition protein Smc [Clostridium sp. BL-8]
MPNIFDGLRKIADNDIIEQVALLETMNITNISKPVIQKAKKRTISIINLIGSKIGRNNVIEEPEVTEIWALIDEKKEELKDCTREELNERLLNILLEKIKGDIEDESEDAISIEVIEEASKLYKVYENLTPGKKADNIYLKYNEKLEGKAKEFINDQPFIDLQETEENIEEIINNMDEKRRKEFLKSMEVENLTLLNVWKKIDRQHFARLIWMAVKAYKGRFTPKEEILPSFVDGDKEVEALKRDEELKKSQRALFELENKIEICKDKINSIESNLKKENRLLNIAVKNKSKAEEDIEELKEQNSKLEEVKKAYEDKVNEIKEKIENAALVDVLDSLTEEFRTVKFESIDINNRISDINIEITYKNELIEDSIKVITGREETIKQIGSEFQQFKMDAENLVNEYNEKKKDVIQREEFKRNEIFERWTSFFDKFIFEFKNLSNVVNFSQKELIHVEECLYELHFIKNPMAMSMGIIEDKKEKEEYQYIDISFTDKFKVEIQYKILGKQEKSIKIVEIIPEF